MAQLAIGAAGLGLQYKQTLDEGKQAAKLGKLQQQQLNAQAKSEEEAGQYASREKRKEAKRAQASQIAQMAANGGAITGSNLLLLSDTAKAYEDDALIMYRNYKQRAVGLRNKGALAKWQGDLARRNSRIRGLSNLGTQIGTAYLLGAFKGTPKTTSASTSSLPAAGPSGFQGAGMQPGG